MPPSFERAPAVILFLGFPSKDFPFHITSHERHTPVSGVSNENRICTWWTGRWTEKERGTNRIFTLCFLLHKQSTMAEYVQQNLEGMLPELEEMERMGVFTSDEIR